MRGVEYWVMLGNWVVASRHRTLRAAERGARRAERDEAEFKHPRRVFIVEVKPAGNVTL